MEKQSITKDVLNNKIFNMLEMMEENIKYQIEAQCSLLAQIKTISYMHHNANNITNS